MNQDKYVFSQLISFLDRSDFNNIVRRRSGDRYIKHFSCWNQLLTMMFGQLGGRESLRDVIVVLDAFHSRCYHLGVGKNVTKSNLAKANKKRDYKIFEEFATHVIAIARNKLTDRKFDIEGRVYAFDSSTIDLCLRLFSWANFRTHKAGIKIHVLHDVETLIPSFIYISEAKLGDVNAMDEIPYEIGSIYVFDRAYNDFERLFRITVIKSFFVVRAKRKMRYKTLRFKQVNEENVISDEVVKLTGMETQKNYPRVLRMVRYYDSERKRTFTYLTNLFTVSAGFVAELYKNRWNVELFFKWLKQHLKVKKFWGHTENAVRIQIYSAITAYCLVAIVLHDLGIDRSAYEALQILSISLMEKVPLYEILSKTRVSEDTTEPDQLDLFGV